MVVAVVIVSVRERRDPARAESTALILSESARLENKIWVLSTVTLMTKLSERDLNAP